MHDYKPSQTMQELKTTLWRFYWSSMIFTAHTNWWCHSLVLIIYFLYSIYAFPVLYAPKESLIIEIYIKYRLCFLFSLVIPYSIEENIQMRFKICIFMKMVQTWTNWQFYERNFEPWLYLWLKYVCKEGPHQSSNIRCYHTEIPCLLLISQ